MNLRKSLFCFLQLLLGFFVLSNSVFASIPLDADTMIMLLENEVEEVCGIEDESEKILEKEDTLETETPYFIRKTNGKQKFTKCGDCNRFGVLHTVCCEEFSADKINDVSFSVSVCAREKRRE